MKPEKSEWLAYVLIAAGLILLILTFLIAYSMLTSLGGIATSRDLAEAIGAILGPIAEAAVRTMFLGVMGWIGSIVTVRGIQLYKESKSAARQNAEKS